VAAFRRWTLLICITVGALGASGVVSARDTTPTTRESTHILVSDLPKEGRDVLATIRRGGPYAYSKDGTVFSNRDQRLPKHPRGFYREFTVKTPGSRDRGARRIVCGGKVVKQGPQVLDTCYYTDDHYSSFKKIKE
jgi:ribonuclease T1